MLGMNADADAPSLEDRRDHASKTAPFDVTSVCITFEQFARWYRNSLFGNELKHRHEMEEKAADEMFTIELPEDPVWSALFWYIVTYPLCAAMYCTMPDVRRPGRDTVVVAITEFLMSLLWIAFFSFCLVDWITVA